MVISEKTPDNQISETMTYDGAYHIRSELNADRD